MTSNLPPHWQLPNPDFRIKLKNLQNSRGDILDQAVALAKSDLDPFSTNALDRVVQKCVSNSTVNYDDLPRFKLAVLSSSTVKHLLPSIRVSGLRFGIWIDVYEGEYGQYIQEVLTPDSGAHKFAPDAVLFSIDSYHVTGGLTAGASEDQAAQHLEEAISNLHHIWQVARKSFGCSIIQQTFVNVFPPLMGNSEHHLAGSRRRFINALNANLRPAAAQESVHLLTIDDQISFDGLWSWHDPELWHRAKQEISLKAAPVYGDMVVSIINARKGRSKKALVLDLDNTLWGGVVGDDGLDGIVLGQGSSLGEGFLAVQDYVYRLSLRGIILAVCSKNDEANAVEVFEKHPDMILRLSDIASFRADWNDKAANIRAISRDLNIGLDSIVFLDDNPFERALVRSILPEVVVPEVPEDPALVPYTLAASRLFESLSITDEDRQRAAQYQGNLAREMEKSATTDLAAYFKSLEMKLEWKSLRASPSLRAVQLVNKTNQFNLTTQRYSAEEFSSLLAGDDVFGWEFRLTDKFGDNGVISVLVCRGEDRSFHIDTWVMSCRVLGRGVEQAVFDVIVSQALGNGYNQIFGKYIPSDKNGMVMLLYKDLGFDMVHSDVGGQQIWVLNLTKPYSASEFIEIVEV